MSALTKEQLDHLEALIDGLGFVSVLSALQVICLEKADHAQTNWQDQAGQEHWSVCAAALEKCEAKILNIGR